MNTLDTTSKSVRACLWGCAIGDSIGLPYEGMSPHKVRRLVTGPLRQRFFFGRGMISDDTEHSLMVGSDLIQAAFDPEAFSRRFAWSLRRWMLQVPAGVGGATARSIFRLLVGVSPERSGVFSAGNGPVMRSAILGCLLSDDEALRREIVGRSTCITHTDPKALYAAQAVAEIAARLGSGAWDERPGIEALRELLFAVAEDEEWRAVVEDAMAVCSGERSFEDLVDGMKSRGVGGYVYYTLPAVIAAWYLHWGDFRGTIRRLVLAGGDTDSTAAIAGALAGITVGEDGLPEEWRKGVFLWPWRENEVHRLSELVPLRGRLWRVPLHLVRNLAFLGAVICHAVWREVRCLVKALYG